MIHDQEAIKDDHYKTLATSVDAEFKEKGSKFLAFAFPVKSVEDCKNHLEELAKQYHDARHYCYAYRINPEEPQLRTNDDGEPNNSAGVPIYNQILSFDVWDTLIVVVRYFGGTKLGVSGLVNAYKTAANMVLEKSGTTEKYITKHLKITFPYTLMNDVMRLIKDEELQIINEEMHLSGSYLLAVRRSRYDAIWQKFESFHQLNLSSPDE